MPALFHLVADTVRAKSRPPPEGPNIPLDGGVTFIGRMVPGPGRLPPSWDQVSGTHCNIVLASKVGCLILIATAQMARFASLAALV